MCWQSTEEFKKCAAPFKNMDMEVFHKTIADLREMKEKTGKKLKLLKFYFRGEPLLHPEIGNMLKAVKEADITECTEVTTNAALLSPELARTFVEYGLDYFRASIYAVIPENQKRITQTSITPEAVKNNIEYLRKYRDEQGAAKPFICAKIMDSPGEENEIFKEMYKNIADETLVDVPWDLAGTEEKALDKLYGGTDEGEKARKKYEATQNNTKRNNVCRYPFTHCIVESDGKVVICCMDWPGKTHIGNIMKESLDNIWHGEKLYNFRVMQLKTCGGGHPLCDGCALPLQNKPEDELYGFPIERLSFRK
jgi:MoaA/NifB/PqqE/SkfB family radical SAM enzyme